MSDLKSFVALQARLYEFLEQQDETTLEAIAGGAVQLAVVDAGETPHPASAVRPMRPSKDPLQAAQDLSKLSSEQERRRYLNAAGLVVGGLRRVAKSLGLRGYSKLVKDELIDFLVGHGPDRADTLGDEPTTPAPSPAARAESDSEAGQQATNQVRLPSAGAAEPDVDAAAIASRLRETETETEGAEYLHTQHLDRESLLAVAAELHLTRVSRLSPAELEKRVLKQAIGARRKFAGLRQW